MRSSNNNTSMLVRLVPTEVRGMATAWMLPYASWHAHHQYLAKDNEQYKLLATIAASLRDAQFVTVGPGIGLTALALCHEAGDRGNRCTAFDVVDRVPPSDSGLRTPRDHPAIRLRIVDSFVDSDAVLSVACEATVVVLDLEKHDGEQERAFVIKLVAKGFKGLLIVDDIHLNPAMERFWAELPLIAPGAVRLDATELGHWSGTGLVAFAPATLDVEITPTEPFAARDRLTGRLL